MSAGDHEGRPYAASHGITTCARRSGYGDGARGDPYVAAGRGYLDDIIEPHETRPRLIDALRLLENKHDRNPARKHGNIPL